jgi:lipopolysaccharide transport system permease protein
VVEYISLSELYSYKDLILQLTRKEFLGLYQQTLLGPFWVLLQPLLTVLVYVLYLTMLLVFPPGRATLFI